MVELKKLYQATIDGDDSKIFHFYCDGATNTLVLIKSARGRRFVGFTTKERFSSTNSARNIRDNINYHF